MNSSSTTPERGYNNPYNPQTEPASYKWYEDQHFKNMRLNDSLQSQSLPAEQPEKSLHSGSCSCGVSYVGTKKSDIAYDTEDNVHYTDIMIYHCPKCGNIDRIEEY